MRFEKKSEEEILNLMPEGEYDGYVYDAEDAISKNGNDMIILTCAFFDLSGKERRLRSYLLAAFPKTLKHFCDHTGLQSAYEKQEIYANDCRGKQIRALIGIEKSDEYGSQNKIVDFLPRAIGPSTKPIITPENIADFQDDDVPF